ncbi:MAG: hypothetical protein IJ158_10000 [Treponema sp.]|nr:hypothetical protein [Treponema sp.]
MQKDLASLLQESAKIAQENGTANMSLAEINDEIAITRAERHNRAESEKEILMTFPQLKPLSSQTIFA